MEFKIADAYIEVHLRQADDAEAKAIEDAAAEDMVKNIAKVGDAMQSFGRFLTVAPMVVALSVAVAGLGAAIFALISSLGLAALAFTALIPGILAFLSVVGILKLEMGDMTKRTFKEFMGTLQDMTAGLKKVADAAIQPGLHDFLKNFNALAPTFTGYVKEISTGIGDLFHQLSQLEQSVSFQQKFKTFLQDTATGTHNLVSALGNVVDAVVTLGAAAGPIWVRFTDDISRATKKFEEWLNLKSATGELQRVLQEAATEAEKWVHIVFNFLDGLVGLFSSGKTEGQKLSQSILNISEAFKKWAWDPNVHGKIKQLLDFLLGIDYKKLFEVASAISSIGLAIQAIGAAQAALPAVVGIISTLMELGPVGLVIVAVVTDLLVFLGVLALVWISSKRFRDAVKEVGMTIKDEVIPRLQDFYHEMHDKIIPAVNDAVNQNLPRLRDAWNDLKKAYDDMKPSLDDLWDKFKRVIGWMIDPGIPVIMGIASRLSGPFVDALSKAMFVASMLNGILSALGSVIQWVRDQFSDAANGIKATMNGLASFMTSKIGDITGAIGRLGSAISGAGNLPLGMLGIGHASGGIVGYAHGGIMAASGGARSGRVLVGEYGPELVDLPGGSHVRTNADTSAMFGGGAGGGGASAVRFVGDTDSAFARFFMQLVRSGQIQILSSAVV